MCSFMVVMGTRQKMALVSLGQGALGLAGPVMLRHHRVEGVRTSTALYTLHYWTAALDWRPSSLAISL